MRPPEKKLPPRPDAEFQGLICWRGRAISSGESISSYYILLKDIEESFSDGCVSDSFDIAKLEHLQSFVEFILSKPPIHLQDVEFSFNLGHQLRRV